MSFEQPPKAEKNPAEYINALNVLKSAEDQLINHPEHGTVAGSLSRLTVYPLSDHDRALELIKDPDLRAKVEALKQIQKKDAAQGENI
ncbi:hypothetical protein IT087_02305 [Candidatus Uhrbacteria bacterium]|nr:hypothetical protein [Candidatus Uhrbacteria bacterium]